MGADSHKLISIQIGRGLAVLAVVFFHISEMAATVYPNVGCSLCAFGNAGVDLFFVISGYVISRVTPGEGHTGSILKFGFDRLTRIYPLYWIYCGLLILPFLVNPSLVNVLTTLDSNWAASFLLIPQSSPPILLVGWTLIHEMYFYMVVFLLLLVRARLSIAVPTAIMLPIIIGNCLPSMRLSSTELSNHPFVAIATNPINAEFVLGFLLQRSGLFLKGNIRACYTAVVGLVLIWIAVALDAPKHDIGLMFRLGWYGVPSAALLLALISANDLFRGKAAEIFRYVGDSSYTMYLSHTLVLAAIAKVWHAYANKDMEYGLALLVILSIFATCCWCFLSYQLLEVPMLGRIKLARERLFPKLAPFSV